jgi:hypothetical protein
VADVARLAVAAHRDGAGELFEDAFAARALGPIEG